MWRLGIILLIYGVRIESHECPQHCHCVEIEVKSRQNYEIIDVSEATDNTYSSADLSISQQIKTTWDKNFENSSSAKVEKDVFSFQITCDYLRDLKVEWLQKLPNPTTQLILQHTLFPSPLAFHRILKLAYTKLENITDFSVINSVINTEHRVTDPPSESGIEEETETECTHLQIVNLSNNSLTHLPPGFFASFCQLQTLDLSDNLIKNFPDEIFHPLINLLRLDLHRNDLDSLNEALFRNLSKLLTLDVSDNNISSIAPSTFQSLTSLNTLILSGNPISRILLLLGTGKRLQVVDASRTGLRQIPSSLERSVRTLNLYGNLLSSIQCGDLDSYSLLSYLNLNNNRISFVEDDAMGRLELLTNLQVSHNRLFQVPKSLPDNLEILNLSFNLIENISNSDFLNLSLLKELSVSNNHIHMIEENSFVDMINLQTLDLSRNPILVLPEMYGLVKLRVLNLSYFTNVSRDWRHVYKSFPTPNPSNIHVLSLESSPTLSQVFLQDTKTLQMYSNLETLDLRFSNLTTLRKDIFGLLTSLKSLRLEGNPWHCDRQMLVTAKWLHHHGGNDFLQDQNQINSLHCATPLRLHRKPLMNLTSHDFQEDHYEEQNSEGIDIFKMKKQSVPIRQSNQVNIGNSIEGAYTGQREKIKAASDSSFKPHLKAFVRKGFEKDNEPSITPSIQINSSLSKKQSEPINAPRNTSKGKGIESLNTNQGISRILQNSIEINSKGDSKRVNDEQIDEVDVGLVRSSNRTGENNTSSITKKLARNSSRDVGSSSSRTVISDTAVSGSGSWAEMTVTKCEGDLSCGSTGGVNRVVHVMNAAEPSKTPTVRTAFVKYSTTSTDISPKSSSTGTPTPYTSTPSFQIDTPSGTPNNSFTVRTDYTARSAKNRSDILSDPRNDNKDNVTVPSATLSYTKQESSTHPGLIVVLFMGVFIAVVLVFTSHQVARVRRQEGYRPQVHEMEVHSISGGVSDVW